MCRGAKRAQTVFRTSQRVQELETERVFFKSILYLIFSLAGSLGQCVPYNTILVLYYDSFILGQMQLSCKRPSKGYGRKCPGWWQCGLAAISQTTTHMHRHHEATMGLAGVSLGRELRALALSHTASVRRGTA